MNGAPWGAFFALQAFLFVGGVIAIVGAIVALLFFAGVGIVSLLR